jgi:acetyl/propionyl-CoA carboxylase alpha subunit
MEYEVGGIKTTLTFFRALMDDEEFIDGKLDTGFIPRFNERHKPVEITESDKDLAVIAAALSFQNVVTAASADVSSQNTRSKWAMSGRRV